MHDNSGTAYADETEDQAGAHHAAARAEIRTAVAVAVAEESMQAIVVAAAVAAGIQQTPSADLVAVPCWREEWAGRRIDGS